MSSLPLKVWDGTQWINIGVQGGTVLYQNEAPASPQTGMIWIDADSETSVLNDEDYLTLSTASATYAPSASPTFTGEVNLPATTNYDGSLLSDTLASKGDVAGETWTGTHDFTGATVTGTFPANDSAAVSSSQATSSGTYTDLSTPGPSVTLTTGTKALVIISTWSRNNNSGNSAYTSFAVSGSSSKAASDGNAIVVNAVNNSTPAIRASAGYIVEGLTAGSNTFTMKYRVSSGTSGDFDNRQISVIDMGS